MGSSKREEPSGARAKRLRGDAELSIRAYREGRSVLMKSDEL